MRVKRGKISFERGDLVEYAMRTFDGKVSWREYYVILDFICFEREKEFYSVKRYSFESSHFIEEGFWTWPYSVQFEGKHVSVVAKANNSS